MNYEEELKILKEKQDKLKEIEHSIEILQNEYMKALEPYLIKQRETNKEINEFENKTISIKLSDLILELSTLLSIPESQINCSFKSEILYPTEIRKEALKCFLLDENREVNPPLTIYLNGKSKNNLFNYCITNSLNFDDLGLDKKSISDGIKFELITDKYNNKKTIFVINGNKENVVFNIHLNDLLNSDELLRKAILTCTKGNILDEPSSIKKS